MTARSKSLRSKIAQRWCFTLNNYENDELEELKQRAGVCCHYAIIGEEVGIGGTKHLQGYLHLTNPNKRRLSCMKKLWSDRAHWEIARGSDLDNKKYCSKDGIFLECGTPCSQGQRNDLMAVAESLKEADIEEVALQYPKQFIMYHRGMEKYAALARPLPKRDFKTQVNVYWGVPGSGKSRLANKEGSEALSMYYKPRGEWWDGYNGQEVVIMDDFYGWLKYDDLLKICDRYPYSVPIKGGYKEFISKQLIITSNVPPEKWYKFKDYDPAALLRRIDYLQEVRKLCNNKTQLLHQNFFIKI